MEDQKENLKLYAELKIQEKAIKTKLEELNPKVRDFISAQGVDKLPTTMGVFSLVAKAVWKYSPAVEKLEKEVDKLKEKEKAEGIATSDARYDLMFKAATKEVAL